MTESCNFCSKENTDKDKTNWIQCEKCKEWYHYGCIGISDAANVSVYICPVCEPEFGPSVPRRVSSRKRPPIDYIALNHGDVIGFKKLHPYCEYFKTEGVFDNEYVKECVDGDELIASWKRLSPDDIPDPAIIRKENYKTLDMTIPHELTVAKVADILGDDMTVEVMDVATQGNSPGWTLGKWKDYYYLPKEERDRIRNVISLEFSYTQLADKVRRPKLVRDFDMVDPIWPTEMKNEREYPKVSLYCLMSVAESYTDFHIDFGGSSVFYHVCQGKKSFLFVPPTVQNLQKYEKWCLSSDQNTTFFGNLVKECYRVDLNKGDSLIIPSGWIHAVYTPVDSLVIGGNFLSKDSIPMELKLVEIEKRTRVPKKFLFPYFNKVVWYVVMSEHTANLSKRERNGLYKLGLYLWQVKDDKGVLQALPSEYKRDYINLLQKFMRNICTDYEQLPTWVNKREGDVSIKEETKRKKSETVKEEDIKL